MSQDVAEKRLALILAELKRREIELNFEWHPRQQVAIEAIEEARHKGSGIPRILYGGALGGGKSFLGCRYAVDLCEKVPGNRWYICRRESSTYMRTTHITMLDAVGILDRPGWKQAKAGKYFWHDNGSRIDYGGLGGDKEDVDKVKSMDLGGLFIDESSEVDEAVAKMAMARVGRIIKAQGYEAVILASNPEQCWLISAFLQDPKPGWVYVPSLPTDNPYLSETYIENVKEIYSATPDLYKAYLEGDWFAVGAANKVFDFDHVTKAIDNDEHGKKIRNLAKGKPVEMGVDIARYGDDSTIITGKFGNHVEILEKCQKQDILATAEKVLGWAREIGPVAIKVDSTGVGGGVEDILAGWGLPVFGITAAARPYDTNRFQNFKTEAAFAFKEKLPELDLAYDKGLREQLLTIRYRVMPGGKLMLETKDEIKKRMGSSPDELDSVILACIDVSPFYKPQGDMFIKDFKVDISPF